MKSFNVLVHDRNSRELESYDVIPYLMDCYIKKKDKPKTFEEFREFIRKESMYQWWGRCQYEILVSDWPSEKRTDKIDVHYQVMMNLDIITEIVINETLNGKAENN